MPAEVLLALAHHPGHAVLGLKGFLLQKVKRLHFCVAGNEDRHRRGHHQQQDHDPDAAGGVLGQACAGRFAQAAQHQQNNG